MDLRAYQGSSTNYVALSLKDLLDARDVYHVHLMEHPNVVATAVGRYRIRHEDSWPDERGTGGHHGTGERTLENSEVRPYSWPAVLVFVEQWVEPEEFSAGRRYDPDQIVPKTLYLPDGRRVPVCVIRAPRQLRTDVAATAIRYPLNNIGGGYPVVLDVQGREHVATLACLVSDGHKVYGLTNRHVTGEPGEVVSARLGGRLQRIGVSAAKQLTRIPFTDLYPGWPGRHVYVNLDVGLIEADDLDVWTAQVRETGTVGPLADFSVNNLSLSLIGCDVRGYGSTSGMMLGEIHALFYRYKSQGGFEYVADFMIGPRTAVDRDPREYADTQPFITRPGDSGTLWLLEPKPKKDATDTRKGEVEPPLLPLAVQWGAHVLGAPEAGERQTYALATCLSSVCGLLGVDLVRDWNLDQPDTWGAIGHFSIASSIVGALSGRFDKLGQLMRNNLLLMSPNTDTILKTEFKGMGDDAFVPLADVPDFFWKHGKQGFTRGLEGPNHFADMDQKRPGDGKDLLALTKDPKNIDADVWDKFYESVRDILTDEKIQQKHRGLLPFRVWQIVDEMIEFARNGKAAEFVCAAGVLAHYVGDACQPLHISYLHDGDPEQPVTRTVHKRDGTDEKVAEPLGKGVHAAYEDEMVSAKRRDILAGLAKTRQVKDGDLVKNGFEAAQRTIELMRDTFRRIPPSDIVEAFVEHGKGKKGRAESLWKEFGEETIACMQNGTHLLASLWESAWKEGQGEQNVHAVDALTERKAMAICARKTFLPSYSIGEIGAKLKKPGA